MTAAKKPRQKAPPAPHEHHEQARVVAWLDWHKIPFFAVPNGARVRPAQARKLRAEGMRAGAPDLVIVRRSPLDGAPIVLEMKRATGGRVSPAQTEMHAELAAEDWRVIVGHGADHAIGLLKAQGFGR